MGKQRKPSPLEHLFWTLWHNEVPDSVPAPVREYKFDPGRNWRLDFAWPGIKFAVEIHGGQWTRGRHQRGAGFAQDLEKMNAAQIAGWVVLQFTTDHMEKMPIQVVENVAEMVHERAHL
jgi:very-short-patch-repair endonuclease